MRSKTILLFILLFLPLNNSFKAETDLNNAQAIFIYNFLMQIQWPGGTINDKYVIGIIGKSTTYDYLKSYTANRLISTKPIEIVEFATVEQISNCQVLFITYGKSSLISSINQQLKGKSVLTVGEKTGIINQGAVIEFAIIGGKLRYKLNEDNAKAQQLFLSSALVNMALKS